MRVVSLVPARRLAVRCLYNQTTAARWGVVIQPWSVCSNFPEGTVIRRRHAVDRSCDSKLAADGQVNNQTDPTKCFSVLHVI